MFNHIKTNLPPRLLALTIVFAGFLTLTSNSALAFSGSGTGTTTDPYQITNIEQLYEINDDLSASYELTEDLDFCDPDDYTDNTGTTSTSNYCEEETTGTGWDMIGSSNSFSGSFDGGEHVVKNLYINTSNISGIGLFQVAGNDNDTVIKNLGVVDAEIINSGTDAATGILVGENVAINAGTIVIENVFTTGSVTSSAPSSGGIFGAGGSIDMTNSYSTASVDGGDRLGWVGGLYGGLTSEIDGITNSYAAGPVSGASTDGFVYETSEGDVTSGTVKNNFFDTQTTGQASSSPAATGKTTAEMQSLSTFTDTSTDGLDSSWDIATVDNYTDETWVIEEGNTYPQLAWYAVNEESSGGEEGSDSNGNEESNGSEEGSEDDSSSSSSGSGGFLASISSSVTDDAGTETDGGKKEQREEDSGAGGGSGNDDASDENNEETEADSEDEEPESSAYEKASQLIQEASELEGADMKRGDKLKRLQGILVEIVGILSNS